MAECSLTAVLPTSEVYRALFEHSFDAIMLSVPDGAVLAANPAACSLLGRTEEEICRLGRRGIVDPDSPGLASILERRLEVGHARGRLTFIRGDGSRIPVEASSSLFVDENGQMRSVIFLRDLSGHERDVEALAESTATLHAIVDSTSDFIWSVDATEHRLLWFNQTLGDYFRDVHGASIEQGMLPEDVFGNLAQYADRWHALYDRALRDGGLTTEYEASVGGAVLQVTIRPLLRAGVVYAFSVFGRNITDRRAAEKAIKEQNVQLEAAVHGTLRAIAAMIEIRDPYTAGHMQRVGAIAADLGREIGWDAERCHWLELAGMVHDIGKIAVPAELLSKPTQLSPLETQLIQSHVEWSYQILQGVGFPFPIADIVRQHHERLDGSGYPAGLSGDAILPEARVLAVADTLESMAAHRPYRPALGVEAAVGELRRHRGTKFDADVVDALERLLTERDYQLPSPSPSPSI